MNALTSRQRASQALSRDLPFALSQRCHGEATLELGGFLPFFVL